MVHYITIVSHAPKQKISFWCEASFNTCVDIRGIIWKYSSAILYILDNMESLILAQDERWRYALHMQVERKL